MPRTFIAPKSSRRIERLVIHCSATPNGRPHTARDIDDWHRQRGFERREGDKERHNPNLSSIGYHWVIRLDGIIETGRHPNEIGAHAQGFNSRSLAVCMIGTDKFTREQWEALKALVEDFQQTYPNEQYHVVGHRNLKGVKKECPGFNVRAWRDGGMQPLDGHII